MGNERYKIAVRFINFKVQRHGMITIDFERFEKSIQVNPCFRNLRSDREI